MNTSDLRFKHLIWTFCRATTALRADLLALTNLGIKEILERSGTRWCLARDIHTKPQDLRRYQSRLKRPTIMRKNGQVSQKVFLVSC